MAPPTETHFEVVAKHCQEACFGPEGPGSEIKSQVDQWRGGLKLGAWLVAGAFALLAIVVTIGIAVVPASIDAKISAALDRRFGEQQHHPVAADRSMFLPRAIAAETKGPTP
jgi:hypothetical protein